jgi:hypothetical protein
MLSPEVRYPIGFFLVTPQVAPAYVEYSVTFSLLERGNTSLAASVDSPADLFSAFHCHRAVIFKQP